MLLIFSQELPTACDGGALSAGAQSSSASKQPEEHSGDEEGDAGDRRDLKAMVEASQGLLAQSVRPHIRSLKRMLHAVQVAAKKFVAETEHPDILLGWIWSTCYSPCARDTLRLILL